MAKVAPSSAAVAAAAELQTARPRLTTPHLQKQRQLRSPAKSLVRPLVLSLFATAAVLLSGAQGQSTGVATGTTDTLSVSPSSETTAALTDISTTLTDISTTLTDISTTLTDSSTLTYRGTTLTDRGTTLTDTTTGALTTSDEITTTTRVDATTTTVVTTQTDAATTTAAVTSTAAVTTAFVPPPVLQVFPQSLTFFGFGRDAEIVCRVEPQPQLLVARNIPLMWSYNCTPLCAASETQSLAESSATLDFTVGSEWNGAYVTCQTGPSWPSGGATISRRLRVSELPTISPADSLLLEGAEVNLTCSVPDDDLSQTLSWRWNCSDLCNGDSSSSAANTPGAHLKLTASSSWNGVTVSCESSILNDTLVNRTIRVRPQPTLHISPNLLVLYAGMTAAVNCTASDVWTAVELAWSVEGCVSGGNSCLLTSDEPVDSLTRRATFVSSSNWNSASLKCSPVSIPASRRSIVMVFVQDVPQLNAVSNVVAYVGMTVVVNCTSSELWTSAQLAWSVRSCRGGGSGCALTSDEAIDNATRRVTFVASTAWNGSVLACSAATPVAQEKLVSVTVRAVPLLIVSSVSVSVYIGVTIRVNCTADAELWTSAQIAWSVRGCGAPGGACALSAEMALNGITRQASFVASSDWNGAALICAATTPVAQETVVRVSVRAFPSLLLSPPGNSATFVEGTNVTLLCVASEDFTPEELMWSAMCLRGRCPSWRQGVWAASAFAASSNTTIPAQQRRQRVAMFLANNMWNGATMRCSVAAYPSSIRSLSIVIIAATTAPSMQESSNKTKIAVGAALGCIGILLLAAGAAYILCKPKRKGRTSPTMPAAARDGHLAAKRSGGAKKERSHHHKDRSRTATGGAGADTPTATTVTTAAAAAHAKPEKPADEERPVQTPTEKTGSRAALACKTDVVDERSLETSAADGGGAATAPLHTAAAAEESTIAATTAAADGRGGASAAAVDSAATPGGDDAEKKDDDYVYYAGGGAGRGKTEDSSAGGLDEKGGGGGGAGRLSTIRAADSEG